MFRINWDVVERDLKKYVPDIYEKIDIKKVKKFIDEVMPLSEKYSLGLITIHEFRHEAENILEKHRKELTKEEWGLCYLILELLAKRYYEFFEYLRRYKLPFFAG